MHVAFFKILNEFSPTFGASVHSDWNIQPFTVSFLEPTKNISNVNERWLVKRGDEFFWRVTGLNKEILQAALNVHIGKKIQADNLILRVAEIICNGNICVDSGVIAVEDLISSVKNSSPVKEICFNFVSPVSFCIDDFDAPYPRAELIFYSLTNKWTQSEMPATVDKKVIRDFEQ